jgi:hypothetical protein
VQYNDSVKIQCFFIIIVVITLALICLSFISCKNGVDLSIYQFTCVSNHIDRPNSDLVLTQPAHCVQVGSHLQSQVSRACVVWRQKCLNDRQLKCFRTEVTNEVQNYDQVEPRSMDDVMAIHVIVMTSTNRCAVQFHHSSELRW